MTEKTLTTENIKPALDALRGELAPWPVVAKKQDRLNTAQLNAANSGITSSLVAQIIANTAAIRALESAITGTGLRALVVATLPAVGTTGILYIVPVTTYDPDTDADVVNYSNEYIWIPVEAGLASEGHYEQVGQTGIVINNGQLTITVNGISVGTFTANQSGDTTAAITVPTNADYVDLSTDQTVAGDKTWTGEQSFTLPIVGSITGTASKAIADEDGTSIKTGYVNRTTNQSMAGQKTFTDNTFFPSPVYHKNTTYEIGNSPASNVVTNIYLADKNNVYTGFTRSVIYASGRTATEIRAKNVFKNGVLDPTGADISSNLNVEVQPNGTKTIYWDGLIRNDVTPYTTNNNSLGSSTNQWSSVYAQSYYYNGTQWGLDKANVWTAQQKITGTNSRGVLSIYSPTHTKGSATSTSELSIGTIFLGDGGATGLANSLGIVSCDLSASGNKTTLSLSAIKNETSSTERVNLVLLYDKSDNTNPEKMLCKGTVLPNSDSTYNLGTSTNKWKSVYAQSYYYNGTQWGLDKANVWTGSNRFRNFGVQSANTIDITQSTYANSQNCGGIGFSDAVNRFWGDIELNVKTDATSEMVFNLSNWKADGTQGVTALRFRYDKTLTTVDFFGADRVVNLGTSTNKWKTLNGINPGALSLPNVSNAVSLDTTNVSMDGTYTYLSVSVNGWLYIALKDTAIKTDGELTFYIGDSGTSSAYAKWAVNFVCSTDGYVRCFIPVLANSRIRVRINPNGGSPTGLTMTIYPCLGNV